MFEEGLPILHLRKPGASSGQMRALLLKIPKVYWNRIVIHSHFNLATRMKLKGIHLTSKVRKKRFNRWKYTRMYRWFHPQLHISTSFHNLNSLYNDKTRYDYVFISPVFDSISKGGYQAGFSKYMLKAAIMNSSQHVIALGGVDETKVDEVCEVGFYGMAMLGYIWNTDDPVGTYAQVQSRVLGSMNADTAMSVDKDGILHIKKISQHV